MKKHLLLTVALLLCHAAACGAGVKTVDQVFDYIDAYYVDPVNYSLLYRDALRNLGRDFPGTIRVEDRGPETYRVVCASREMEFRIRRRDQPSNIRQMEKIMRTCAPEKLLKKIRESKQTDEQVILALLLNTLDPHSSFMTAQMHRELNTDLHGRFSGIGAEITLQNGVITVVSPIDDTPAFNAGIKTGDQIIRINGEPTKGMTVVEAVRKIRGPKNTAVRLTIRRVKAVKPMDLTITRGMINIKTVRFKLYDGRIGYIRLSSFQELTIEELQAALRELGREKGPVQGLLLDLRNNPGGLLDQAVKVSDQFLKSGIIVSTKGRHYKSVTRARARNQGDEPTFPVVILVNEGTASAAEIVSAAMQDNRKALIVGTQTFGKGSVQTLYPLEEGFALKLTTARYYTPNGRAVQEKGITPDLMVGNSRGFREKDLKDHNQGRLAGGRSRAEDGQKRDLESDREAQLQTGLDLLRKIIAAGDYRKGLQAFNAASKTAQ